MQNAAYGAREREDTMKRMLSVAVMLAAVAAVGRAQYVEDSVPASAWVGDMVYNARWDAVVGVGEVGNSMFGISCERNEVWAAVYVERPLRLAFNSSQNKVYCTRGDGWDDYVRVTDGLQLHYITEFPLTGALDLVWDSVDNRVLVACQEEERIAVIDCNSDSIIGYIHVPGDPSYLELNTLHHKLYVRNWNETVSIIDLNTQQVIRTFGLGTVAQFGYYSPAADKYYCGTGDLFVFSGAGDTLAAGITGAESHSLMFVGTYIGGTTTDSVFVIDGGGDSIATVLPTQYGRNVDLLFWTAQTDRVYAMSQRGTMDVFRGDGSGRIMSFPFVGNALCAAYSPEYGRLYIGSANSNRVYVVRDTIVGIEEPADDVADPTSLRAKPNPFCGSVRIVADGQPGVTPVAVYSQDGRLVRMLHMAGGACEWAGDDTDSRPVAAGVYVVTAGADRQGRILVVKAR
jgi:DNA-binding beta-propeller fold protein YncE